MRQETEQKGGEGKREEAGNETEIDNARKERGKAESEQNNKDAGKQVKHIRKDEQGGPARRKARG